MCSTFSSCSSTSSSYLLKKGMIEKKSEMDTREAKINEGFFFYFILKYAVSVFLSAWSPAGGGRIDGGSAAEHVAHR